jgi:electron transfer flavoprotein alpha subunit
LGTTNDVWVFVEHDRGAPKKVALELATKARELAAALGGRAAAVAFGPGAAASADRLGNYGASVVYVAEDAAFEEFYVTPHARVLADLIQEKQPKLVLFGATPNGKDIAARLAARLDLGLIVNATDVNVESGGRVSVIKPAFGGQINVNSAFTTDRTGLVLLRPNAVTPEQSGGGSAIEQIAAAIGDAEKLSRIVDHVEEAGAAAPLEEASVIVAGGRGVGGPEGFGVLRGLAEALGGAVGASRAAVDAGWISYPHQLGQTGKTVKPQLYIACGISGSIQHKVGMQTSSYIVAINKNADAPIFTFCDLGIVGDLFQIVPALTEAIRARKQMG